MKAADDSDSVFKELYSTLRRYLGKFFIQYDLAWNLYNLGLRKNTQ